MSGNALVGLAALYAVAGLGWRWMGRQRDALYYFITAALVGVASLVLVTIFGFCAVGDPNGATWIYVLYALAALVGSVVVTRAERNSQRDSNNCPACSPGSPRDCPR